MINRARTLNFLLYFGSWVLLGWAVITGIAKIPNDVVGGGYSNIDGEWMRWNTEFILNYSKTFDVSPFNAFSGTGSIYPPNMPWFNPGALALSLPFDLITVIQISFLIYMLQLGGSFLILGQVLKFSLPVSTIAAQIYIIVMSPPFSRLFMPVEFFSAAPMYAQLFMILNLAIAVFITVGRSRAIWSSILGIFLLTTLAVIGLLSAPYSIVFLCLPYVLLGLVLLLFSYSMRNEFVWKLAALVIMASVVFALGFPEYILAMSENSARTPQSHINWSMLLSPSAWWSQFKQYNVCDDPRALMCPGNGVAWVNLVGALGAVTLAIRGHGLHRLIGIWGILITIFVYFYAHLGFTGWLGKFGAIHVVFISWSSYPLLCICAVGGIFLILKQLTFIPLEFSHLTDKALANSKVSRSSNENGQQWTTIHWFGTFVLIILAVIASTWLAINPPTIIGSRFAIITICGILIISLLIFILISFLIRYRTDLARHFINSISLKISHLEQLYRQRQKLIVYIFPLLCTIVIFAALHLISSPIRQPQTGSIIEYLKNHGTLNLYGEFPGYTTTIWSETLDQLDETGISKNLAFYRYISARSYFDTRYGNRFTGIDLKSLGIPTYEEYGQWVSILMKLYTVAVMGNDLVRQSSHQTSPHMLRIYRPNFDLLRSLGVRFLITDSRHPANAQLTLRAQERMPGALSVFLYELNSPNLANFSPTEVGLVSGGFVDYIENIRNNAFKLSLRTYVGESIQEKLLPVTASKMVLVEDGYFISAKSDGASAILLPLQFSNCWKITSDTIKSASPKLYRANLVQTLLVFKSSVSITLEYDFGLGDKAQCRRQDAAELKELTGDSPYELLVAE